MTLLGERAGVLVAAAGAAWEVEALRVVSAPPTRAVLVKRCVDLADLLASAATGQARVAVAAVELPGLDADSVSNLRRAGVALILVSGPGVRAGVGDLPGVAAVVGFEDLARLESLVPAAAAGSGDPAGVGGPGGEPLVRPASATGADAGEGPPPGDPQGRVTAVWGPTGAPGRTTVAVNLAAELAARGHDTILVDADGYGGAVAQHLGVLDEVSGLLGAVRLANGGRLDATGLAATARELSPRFRVLTGLPRADRWAEVRPAAFDALLGTARALCRHVVLDLGFNLEQDAPGYGAGTPQRNHMTVAGLDLADEVVVVGSADPVGLARLARGLVELPRVVPAATTRVVVNRVRASLGWGEQEVRAMVEGFVVPSSVHFLPDDPAAADRALLAGKPLREVGDSALARAAGRVAEAVQGSGSPAPRRGPVRLRRRRAGTTR
ncbi:MAG TPA: hypothetical protein VFZ64_11100 [Nocardioidaceae bacterium]